MLNKFKASLEYMGFKDPNLNHTQDDKFMFKFEDEKVNKVWICMHRFYTLGRTDEINSLSVELIKKLETI